MLLLQRGGGYCRALAWGGWLDLGSTGISYKVRLAKGSTIEGGQYFNRLIRARQDAGGDRSEAGEQLIDILPMQIINVNMQASSYSLRSRATYKTRLRESVPAIWRPHGRLQHA